MGTLDVGTVGICTGDWMKKYVVLAGLGTLEEKHLRFTGPQAGLLDALLAGEPAVAVDAIFARVRRELVDFAGIEAAEPTPHFAGQLRGYQRAGLPWLFFLHPFAFGGSLAAAIRFCKPTQLLPLPPT